MHRIALLGMMLLAATPVMAQPANPPARPAAPDTPATPDTTAVGRVDQRAAQMHRRLQITPDQEPAWRAFAQAMHDNAASADQAYRQHAAHVATMSAVENLRVFARIEQARAQGLQAMLASFESLYGVLSDEQKKTADAIFRRQEERMAQRRNRHR